MAKNVVENVIIQSRREKIPQLFADHKQLFTANPVMDYSSVSPLRSLWFLQPNFICQFGGFIPFTHIIDSNNDNVRVSSTL